MYHIRTPESRPGALRTWCGAEPEHMVFYPPSTGDAKIPLLTEGAWVSEHADKYPGLCQECVCRFRAVNTREPQKKIVEKVTGQSQADLPF